jgi:hypothetical protein
MRVRFKTLFQLAGIVACLGMMLLPGPAHAATLRSFDMTIPASVVKVTPVVTVKAGDTLSKLGYMYRLPWQGVYCTNRRVIGPNPNALRIGERLVMKSTSCNVYSGYGNTANTITTAEYNTNGTPQQIAWRLLANFGGNRPVEYYCLSNIIARESGWRLTAENPSGAYGIPQALPGWKMGPGWQYSAYVQLRWMIKVYIPGTPRYGTPCGAWYWWQRQGWY